MHQGDLWSSWRTNEHGRKRKVANFCPDHPRCVIEIKSRMGNFPENSLNFKFCEDWLQGFQRARSRKSPFHISVAFRLYKGWYHRTIRANNKRLHNEKKITISMCVIYSYKKTYMYIYKYSMCRAGVVVFNCIQIVYKDLMHRFSFLVAKLLRT